MAPRARELIELILAEAEHLADLAIGEATAITDQIGDHRRVIAPVLLVDVLHHLFTAVVLEVDVDVRRLAALRRDEALEQQAHPDRIDRGDAEAIADDRVRRGAARSEERRVGKGGRSRW